ncbi:BolA/IbaG family iron-sulfur metabolism protein, partial [Parasutterella excrementihominis]
LYHLFVISRRFEGLPKIDRHRIVYEYLKPFIGHGIHNINMTLLAPSESRH